MRTIQLLTSASLGVLLLAACARVASAQTYIWTDERGVVHAAADPSEVPASQREKAVRDASNARPAVKVIPEEDAPVPASPRVSPIPSDDASGPSSRPTHKVRKSQPPAADEQPAKKLDPDHLPPPDPGFEWNCANDPEGGPPKCEQFEKKSSKRARRADARDAARQELGVSPTDEFDPDVAKKVNERAEEEFKKTTPTPTTGASKQDGGSDSGDSSGDD
ncbi:MAG: hypothetical protein ACHQ6T_10050 [Myxococcota bacterium]